MNIALTGDHCSGKTTAGLILEDYGYTIINTTDILDGVALHHDMSRAIFLEYAAEHPEVDATIKEYILRFNKSANDLIFDSKLAWHFAENTYRVYIRASEETQTLRAMSRRNTKSIKQLDDFKIVMDRLLHSGKLERHNFNNNYRLDMNAYNLIINSDYSEPDTVAMLIDREFKRRPNDNVVIVNAEAYRRNIQKGYYD